MGWDKKETGGMRGDNTRGETDPHKEENRIGKDIIPYFMERGKEENVIGVTKRDGMK